MKKPQKYLPKEIYRYDLIDVLDYIENKVPHFKRKIWKELCNLGYINNDTSIYINFYEIFNNYKDEDIQEGLELLYKEFPDLKTDVFLFDISW